MSNEKKFSNLQEVAIDLRRDLQNRDFIFIFANNGKGKTRLSTEFKDIGKNSNNTDTIYYNAFTEDLFIWDNDLDNDSERILRLNTRSKFFDGLLTNEMDTRIKEFLIRYADFDFKILSKKIKRSYIENNKVKLSDEVEEITYVSFEREEVLNGRPNILSDIKISRGEESIFIWCFFLAIIRMVFDAEEETDAYSWVKNIYIDDPVTSLDEDYIVTVACDLISLLHEEEAADNKVIVSTHHNLFHHILVNQMKYLKGRNWERHLKQYYLDFVANSQKPYFLIEEKGDTPLAYHLAILKNVKQAIDDNNVETYHFNMMRSVLEKTATFFGYKAFGECLEKNNEALHSRLLNMYSHGKESSFNFRRPSEVDKQGLKNILDAYLDRYEVNEDIYSL